MSQPDQPPIQMYEVGLPILRYNLRVYLRESHHLNPLDKVVLQLIQAGVTTEARMAKLLGFPNEKAVHSVVLDLLDQGAITPIGAFFALTLRGEKLLDGAPIITEKIEKLTALYDPIEKELSFEEQAHMDARTVILEEIRPLRTPDVELDDHYFLARQEKIKSRIKHLRAEAQEKTPFAEVDFDITQVERITTSTYYDPVPVMVFPPSASGLPEFLVGTPDEVDGDLTQKIRDLETDRHVEYRLGVLPTLADSETRLPAAARKFSERVTPQLHPQARADGLTESYHKILQSTDDTIVVMTNLLMNDQSDAILVRALTDAMAERPDLTFQVYVYQTPHEQWDSRTRRSTKALQEQAEKSKGRHQVVAVPQRIGHTLLSSQEGLYLRGMKQYVHVKQSESVILQEGILLPPQDPEVQEIKKQVQDIWELVL